MEDLSLTFYPTVAAAALHENLGSELVVYAIAVALKITPGDRCVSRALVAAADLGVFRSPARA